MNIEDHIERLFNSAKIYQMKIPYKFDEILDACKEIVKINNLDSCFDDLLYFKKRWVFHLLIVQLML